MPVISLTGWQAGFKTDAVYSNARISRIDSERLRNEIDKRKIVIVAGFQGINKYDDITTLGRGGSDTSAVAIAASLKADLCQIYTDVDGVYTADPEKDPTATKYSTLTFDKALADNLRIMDQTAFALCKENNMPIIVFDMNKVGNLYNLVKGENVGTIVTK